VLLKKGVLFRGTKKGVFVEMGVLLNKGGPAILKGVLSSKGVINFAQLALSQKMS
jgi:hypothetical protein